MVLSHLRAAISDAMSAELPEDHFGTGNVKHKPDTEIDGKDDIIEMSGTEKDNVTELSFTIPLDSGDSRDKKLVPDKKVKIICAYGKRDTLKLKHSKRIKFEIEL